MLGHASSRTRYEAGDNSNDLSNGQKLSTVQDKDGLARAEPWEISISLEKACMTMSDPSSDERDDLVTDLILLALLAERQGRQVLAGTLLADYAFIDGDRLMDDA